MLPFILCKVALTVISSPGDTEANRGIKDQIKERRNEKR